MADAPALLSLHRSVLEEGRYFITDVAEFHNSIARQEELIRMLYRHPGSCMFVARLEQQLVGMVLIRGGVLQRMQHVGKLEIFVSADCRGVGVGGALMEAALTWAEEHPTLRKLGLSVFEDNTRAVAVYRAAGFAVEGRRVGEYMELDGSLRNDLLMYRRV